MKNLVPAAKHRIDPFSLYIEKEPLLSDFSKKIVCMGSCFAGAVAKNLNELGFSTFYDIRSCYRFSPRSIADYLDSLLQSKPSHNFHTSSDRKFLRSLRHLDTFDLYENEKALFKRCQDIDILFKEQLKSADIIIVTFGTSRYLRHLPSNNVITNVGGIDENSRESIIPTMDELNK